MHILQLNPSYSHCHWPQSSHSRTCRVPLTICNLTPVHCVFFMHSAWYTSSLQPNRIIYWLWSRRTNIIGGPASWHPYLVTFWGLAHFLSVSSFTGNSVNPFSQSQHLKS